MRAVIALPVEPSLSRLRSRVYIVAGPRILEDSIAVDELFTDRVIAIVLQRHDDRV